MIVTYYSYKGGVGRSQLCANVASFLCYRKDKKVLLWDWDFEAPGLHYFFNKKNKHIKQEGTIEMLMAYSDLMRTKQKVTKEDYPSLSQSSFIPLLKTEKGKVDLIPAGNYNDNYILNVNSFDWYEFYELLDGKTFIENLKTWIKSLDYDYIFVDSRTGINDYSGLCNIQLPDTNIVVMAANTQNMEGCKRIVDGILNSEYTKQNFRKNYIFPVLSRMNVHHSRYEEWANAFTENFQSLITTLDNTIEQEYSNEIFREFYLNKTLLYHTDELLAGENLLIKDKKLLIPRNSFLSQIANISNYLVSLKEQGYVGIMNQIAKGTWMQWAEHSVLNEDIKKAIIAYDYAEEYEQSIELGGSFVSFFEMGKKNIFKNKEEALRYFDKAIEINPKDATIFYNRGDVLNDLGRKEEALESYDKAIEINPKYVDAFYNCGAVLNDLGQKEEALKNFDKVIELNPKYANAFIYRGNLLRYLGRKEEALTSYDKAIELNPKYALAFNNRGNVLNDLNRKEEALESYDKAIEINPKYAGAFNNRGIVLNDLNRKEEALESYNKALEINPKGADTWSKRGYSLFFLSRIEESIDAFQNAIKYSNTDSFINKVNLSFIKIFQNKLEEAKQILDDLWKEAEEKSPFTAKNLGHYFLLKNNKAIALEYYQKCLDLESIEDMYEHLQNDYKFLKLEDKGITSEAYIQIIQQLK